jgi:hypothetical protein
MDVNEDERLFNIILRHKYHAFISLKLDKCLPSIFIGRSDFSGGVLSIFTGCESAVELRVEKSKAGKHRLLFIIIKQT